MRRYYLNQLPVIGLVILFLLSCRLFTPDQPDPMVETIVALNKRISSLEETIHAPTFTPTSTATPTPTFTPTVTPTNTPLPTSTFTPTPRTGILIGYKAPNFRLVDLNDQEIALEDYIGTYVIINFFATWCGPCQSEMPAFQTMYEKYMGESLVMLGVSIDGSSTIRNVPNFISKYGVTYPVLLDTAKLAQVQYSIRNVPTSYFLDQAGIIRDIQIGSMTEAQLEEKIESLLER